MTLTPEERDVAYNNKVCNIQTKMDAAECVKFLEDDFLRHKNEWGNQELDEYLEAISAVIQAIPGIYRNSGRIGADSENPSWKILLDILSVARVYE